MLDAPNMADLSEDKDKVETLGFQPHLLIAEDDGDQRALLQSLFTTEGFIVTMAANGLEACEALERQAFHCVLTDVRMPHMSGEELCQKILAKDSNMPVIILTGYGNISNAVENMRNGAFDYITKPYNERDLLGRVRRAVEKRHLDDQIIHLRNQVVPRRFSDYLIGNSEPIKMILSQINTISKNNITVLITGESGTGKELVARTVHMTSQRAKKKFVTVNCGAIPENLMESELFGHAKGSFTGAYYDKAGLFEEANEGTIFLNVIHEIS